VGPLDPGNYGVNEKVIDRHGRRDGDLDMVRRRGIARTEAREPHAQRADLVARMRTFAIRMDQNSRLGSHQDGDQRKDAECSGHRAAHRYDATGAQVPCKGGDELSLPYFAGRCASVGEGGTRRS
jgi:hypothetical protein